MSGNESEWESRRRLREDGTENDTEDWEARRRMREHGVNDAEITDNLEDSVGGGFEKAFIDDITAEIGDLVFHDEFSNPDVNVTHDRDTAEHNIVSGARNNQDIEHVVQVMGKSPPEVDIIGYVSQDQLQTADNLVNENYVDVVTDRWTGVAVPINVDIPYMRAVHEKHGRIFEVTIELISVRRGLEPGGE